MRATMIATRPSTMAAASYIRLRQAHRHRYLRLVHHSLLNEVATEIEVVGRDSENNLLQNHVIVRIAELLEKLSHIHITTLRDIITPTVND